MTKLMTLKSAHFSPIIRILILTALYAKCSEVKAVVNDSIWHDSITGTRIHLQKHDTLTPYTCPLHFFGKKPNGGPRNPALQALAEDLAINALVFSWDHFITDREWARVNSHSLRTNLTDGWVWDGLSYGVSLLYPLAGSFTWEIFCETNRPATNDLLSTGIGGAAIGEVTHRASDIFFDNSKRGINRMLREFIGTMLNPVRGLHRILSGEMFRVNRLHPGKKEAPEPCSFQIGLGDRYIHEESPHRG